MSVSLSRYAALVKNLRGVVFFKPSEDVDELVEWLVKRFKYRNVGVPPSLVEFIDERKLKGNPFVQLSYPAADFIEFSKQIASERGVDSSAIEAAVLASVYVSPIIVLGVKGCEALSKLAVETVESKTSLDDKGWRLHLRIADYTVLDFYQWSSSHAENLWLTSLDPREFTCERAERIVKDKKRYWRLERGDEKPWKFMYYVDLAQMAAGDEKLLRVVRRFDSKVLSAGLAIEAAVLVTKENIHLS